MFTGLVEEVGAVQALSKTAEGARLWIRAGAVVEGMRIGDSLAVNGCCLTLAARAGSLLSFDLLEETLRLTNLGALAPDAKVNLERALPADGRIGGHFVQGHIDCAGEVRDFRAKGADFRLEVAFPIPFSSLIAPKGSICVDGISLTVAEARESSFVVWIIPHTLAVTNLGAAAEGARVNLEFDIVARYIARMVASRGV